MQGIFLDRDGVINKERADYVKDWDEFAFLPRVLPALSLLAELDIPTFIITNQSVIGRQITSCAGIEIIHEKMLAEINATGLHVREIFICPHHPDDGCICRKPAPGMLIRAATAYDLDLSECLFIGDSITDYQAARSCGCRSILVRSGRQGTLLESLLEKRNVNNECGANSTPLIFDDLFIAVKFLVTVLLPTERASVE